MKIQHFAVMLAVFAVGYVVARYYPKLGNMVGLP